VVDILIFTVTELQGLAALGVPVNLAHAIAATLQTNTGGLQQAAVHQLLLKYNCLRVVNETDSIETFHNNTISLQHITKFILLNSSLVQRL